MTGARIITTGPIFEGKAGRIISTWGRNYLQAMIEAGEQKLNDYLRPRPAGVYLSVAEARKGKASTGNYRRNISSRLTNGYTVGIITDGGRVVYGPWLEGESSRNKTTRFKGYRSFRTTRDWLSKMANGKGQKMAKYLVSRLND